MTTTLPLGPAKLIALSRARGLAPEALVREALNVILTDTPAPAFNAATTGSVLVKAMQGSPFGELDLV